MRLNCDHEELRGALHFDYPLNKLNSWRVGGVSECFYAPADREDLALFLRACPPDVPIFVLGLGSNVLVRDGGMRGVVLSLRPAFDFVSATDEVVHAGSGAPCAKAARHSVRQGLSGLEFMAGIPGTVGGALAMNAGAYGGETWARVSRVEVIERNGRSRIRSRSDYHADYRELRLTDEAAAGGVEEEWFLAAWFDLAPSDDRDELEHTVRARLRQRNSEQPTDQFSCGSVFRNPEQDHAGRLIESCGLKNYAIGDAQVSARHANFIINRGHATASDIEALIHYVGERVEEMTGIKLKPEVRIVGEAA